MIEFVETIKKHGATGLMAILLFINNQRINKLEEQLYDCLRDYPRRASSSEKPISKTFFYAILPEKIKYEKTNRRHSKG